jgi:membrane dipeptidase
MPLMIDAHLDLAWSALSFDRDLTEPIARINSREFGMTDSQARGNATVGLQELRSGGVAICLATLLAHARPDLRPAEGHRRISLEYRSASAAFAIARGQLAYYQLLEQQAHVKVLESTEDLNAHWSSWNSQSLRDKPLPPIGLIISMEGADAIVEPSQTQLWYALGLRVVGPVHYGHNQYACGTGESGPLTNSGVSLLHELDRLGIILDVTHLSDAGFSKALDEFGGAVLASHQNCRALVPGDRQFSDDQLRCLIDRNSVVGVALDNWMLIPEWKTGVTSRSAVTLDKVADQIDHICQLAGNHQHVAIGTDLDGGFGAEQSPAGLNTIADVQNLTHFLEQRGYSTTAVDDIFHGNWLRFFRNHLPSAF